MLTVDDKQVALAYGGGNEPVSVVGRVHLEKGHKAALSMNLRQQQTVKPMPN